MAHSRFLWCVGGGKAVINAILILGPQRWVFTGARKGRAAGHGEYVIRDDDK